ncbi:MAG: AlpA family transcriptional regulator [Magnetococcales bacterium]|nr:AlpA family transcriptional regulator [Magnetococcales bacterium]
MTDSKRVLRIDDVVAKSGIPRSSLYRMIKSGKFPVQVKLSERSVGWIESDVDEWIRSRQAS